MLAFLDKLELRQIYMLFGSVTFLALTALFIFEGKPLYQRYQQTDEQLNSLRQLGVQPAGSGLKAIEAEVKKYQQELLGELQNIPSRQLESHIIAALQSNAWQSEVNLLSIEPLESVQGLPYEEISFRLEIEGYYYNLDDWINNVSTQLGFVVFKEYALKVRQQANNPVLHARVLLSAYRVGVES